MKITLMSSKLFVAALLLTSRMHAEIVELKSEEQYQSILKDGKPAIIKFSADWCGACQSVKAEYNTLAQDPALQHVTFVDVNIDNFQPLAQKYGVSGIPTFLYVQNGAIKKQEVGIKDPSQFGKTVRDNIASQFNNAVAPLTDVKHAESVSSPEQLAHVDAHQAATAHPDMDHAANEAMGIIAKIKALFISAFVSFKNMLLEAIAWVKGLFGR